MTNRRTFIKQSAAASAGLFVAPSVFSFHGSPNEKVVMGVMGTNSRGLYLAKMLAKQPNVEVAYICDVDENVI
ncbi:MAG: twin-arginine translocation signal domain-containing protein, partial [Chryseolinea sp.]